MGFEPIHEGKKKHSFSDLSVFYIIASDGRRANGYRWKACQCHLIPMEGVPMSFVCYATCPPSWESGIIRCLTCPESNLWSILHPKAQSTSKNVDGFMFAWLRFPLVFLFISLHVCPPLLRHHGNLLLKFRQGRNEHVHFCPSFSCLPLD